MDKNEIQRKVEIGNFVANNGRILRTINLLGDKYKRLTDIGYVLGDLEQDDIIKSIAYLRDAGYLILRRISDKRDVETSEAAFTDLECRLSPKGTQLLCGVITDGCVDV